MIMGELNEWEGKTPTEEKKTPMGVPNVISSYASFDIYRN